jgi:protein O-GlcNAc transferase
MVETLAEWLARAVALHQQGQLAAAEQLYRQILVQAPQHFDALHLLGLVAFQRGDPDSALRLIGQALTLNPNSAPAQANLGMILSALGRPAAALPCIDRALALNPASVADWRRRGLALAALGRWQEAAESYRRGLALEPEHVGLLVDRGTALLELKRPGEAVDVFDRALVRQPSEVAALANRGTGLRLLGRAAEALASYDRALALKPDDPVLLSNRGLVLADLGRQEEAIRCYDRALMVEPDHLEGLINRGTALAVLGRHEAALASYERAMSLHPQDARAAAAHGAVLLKLERAEAALASLERALALAPNHAEALNNRGTALAALGRWEGALVNFEHVLTLAPDNAQALNNCGSALQALRRHEEAVRRFARLVEIAPDFPYAKGNLLASRLHCCDWRDHQALVGAIETAIGAGQPAADPFVVLSVSGSAALQRLAAERYAAEKYPAAAVPLWAAPRAEHERRRIAYLSADFRDHPVGYLLAGLIEAHDRSRYELVALSWGRSAPDETRQRLEAAFDQFIDVDVLSDRDAASRLSALEPDIAVDLMGYTNGARPGILACRPAPIQLGLLGYPGTSAAAWLDYLIADPETVPATAAPNYTEQLVMVPAPFLPPDTTRRLGQTVPTRATCGLPERGFVFCSFNNSYKIQPPVFAIWLRLLRQVEDSVLWLAAADPVSVRNLKSSAAAAGVAAERLIFAPRLADRADHFARHALADLTLDTFPYNAHVTAADALWCGLPLITCAGTSFAGRVAGSLLSAVSLTELIAATPAEYEALALDLARSRDRLAAIKAELLQGRPLLSDIGRYCRQLESAYQAIWQRHCRGDPPHGFAVTRVD